MLQKIYDTVRQAIFAQIYLSPWIFNRVTRNFQGVQQITRILPDYQELCLHLSFDLSGNMHPEIDNESTHADHFEAILIPKLLNNNLYSQHKQYIIVVGGNTTCYQVFIPWMIDLYKRHQHQAYIIGFNPPGVGLSHGATNNPDEYCAALKSIVDNLCNNQVPPQNILIFGHSLGAAIAARTVAEYNEAGKPLRLFADRTMKNLSETVATKIQAAIPTAFLRYTLGALLYILMKFLIKALKLELEVAKDFARINELNRGNAWAMMAREDEVIKDCDLCHELSNTQTPYFKKFTLKPSEKLRKAHSKPHSELIEENGKLSAEQYLDTFIRIKI